MSRAWGREICVGSPKSGFHAWLNVSAQIVSPRLAHGVPAQLVWATHRLMKGPRSSLNGNDDSGMCHGSNLCAQLKRDRIQLSF